MSERLPEEGSRPGYVRLSDDCSPKLLEEPCVYNRATDELYIVNQEALEFLRRCAGGVPFPAGSDEAAFVDFCLEEGILVLCRGPARRELNPVQSPVPSLRYLLLHITARCNLACRHCFLGNAANEELALERVTSAVDEFEGMQGLRLMVSGGEPLLHREFDTLNDYVAGKDLRSVLLTNGTLLDEEKVARLRFSEVQISLDGLEPAHNYLRGEGSFRRSLAALKLLREAGIQVSVATMIHRHNLEDLDRLQELLADVGVREWSLDVPSPAGRMGASPDLALGPAVAGPQLARSYGGAIHEPAPGYACGVHLMAVMADGSLAACGFFAGRPLGSIEEGLAAGWQRKPRTTLQELDCSCEHVEDCRGGCRFRAAGYNNAKSPDLCQCYRYGVL